MMGKKKLDECQMLDPCHLRSGVEFAVKYLGFQCIEDLRQGERYHSNTTSAAIRGVLALNAKSKKKKFPVVVLTKSTYGIRVRDPATSSVLVDAPIERIAYCTADNVHSRIYAFICRCQLNETAQIHVFKCAKIQLAVNMSLTMNQIFQLVADERRQLSLREEQTTAFCDLQKAELEAASSKAASRKDWIVFT